MRWITLLGRIGTVILMIGLALLVFSLIPSGARSQSTWSQPIEPEQYIIRDIIRELGVYSPQTGLQISVESTDNVHVYFLGVSPVELDNWQTQVREAYPDLDEIFIRFWVVPMIFFHEAYPEETPPNLDDPQTWDMMWDVAVLDKGLQTHPEIILWDPPPSSSFSHELFPADALDIMVIIANPSSSAVEVDMEIRDLAALAAKERVVAAARLLVSIGIVLTIPWLILRKVKKSTF